MKADKETSAYAQMGMAAMLPGMVRMLELMQAEVNNMRAQLAAMQNGQVSRKRGRPRLDDEARERKRIADREAKRRQRAAAKKSVQSSVQKGFWDRMTPRQRKARLAAMAAGKRPKVKLEKVA